MRILTAVLMAALLVLLPAPVVMAQADGPSKLDMSAAERYVSELEKQAQRMKGKPFDVKRFGSGALTRVKKLKKAWPDDPRVEDLFQRVRTVVKLSRGAVFEITPAMLAYRAQGKALAEALSAEAESAWAAFETDWTGTRRYLATPFPTEEPESAAAERAMVGRTVLLDGFEFPTREFTNSGRQFVHIGDGRQGYYFVELSNRHWLGAYEALKRYRREASSDLPQPWTIAGTITGGEVLIPRTGEPSPGDTARFGWVVEPKAIWVPGTAFATALASHPDGGTFAGEDLLYDLKRPFLTYRRIPSDVEPQKLVEIFATAIKERNFELYLAALDPARKEGPNALGRLRYYWDNNLVRYDEIYVHIDPFEVGKITALKGEILDNDDDENFFLDDTDKAEIEERADDLEEQVMVKIRAFDEKGKQVGLPKDVELRRYQGGRWYIMSGFPL